MWEFILVIFGGIYWILRWAYETGTQQGAQMSLEERRKRREARQKKWLEKSTNLPLEKEITTKMRDEELSKEFLPELQEAAKELKMMNDSFFFGYHVYYPNYYCKNNVDAIRIALANRGYLRYEDARWGFSNDVPSRLRRDPARYTEAVDNRREFMEWIDKRLKEHGIDEEMCMETTKLYHLNEHTSRFCGCFIYAPASIKDEIVDYVDMFDNV